MNFINEILSSNKFANFNHSDTMIGFRLNREDSWTYYWFEKVGDTWFFDHSYSQNTGETKRSCRCMPKSIQRIYLAHIGLSSDYID